MMIKTQVQIPDHMYREAKRLARSREMSFAEVVRRGIELVLAVYPVLSRGPGTWALPKPRKLGWKGLSPARLRDLAGETTTEIDARQRRARHALV